MARAVLTITNLAANAAVADVAGDALDEDGHVLTLPSNCTLEELVLRITNTANAAQDVTVLAGENPPAFGAGLGDLVVTVPDGDPAAATVFLGLLESGRFLNADGTVLIDVEVGTTGFITVLRVPSVA